MKCCSCWRPNLDLLVPSSQDAELGIGKVLALISRPIEASKIFVLNKPQSCMLLLKKKLHHALTHPEDTSTAKAILCRAKPLQLRKDNSLERSHSSRAVLKETLAKGHEIVMNGPRIGNNTLHYARRISPWVCWQQAPEIELSFQGVMLCPSHQC